jgi:hypothetical protein
VCSTGLAVLRRDGFASLDDAVDHEAPRLSHVGPRSITTRPLRFRGAHLFVNAVIGGSLRVDVLDRAGRVIAPYRGDETVASPGDYTRAPVRWKNASSLEALRGEVVRFRFTLTRASLFAFWVSGSSRGDSGGYVAAGDATPT